MFISVDDGIYITKYDVTRSNLTGKSESSYEDHSQAYSKSTRTSDDISKYVMD